MAVDDDERMLREKSIASYRRLVDKAFGNILNDTSVAIEASKAFATTDKIVENKEDQQTGEYMTQLMEALYHTAETLKERYQTKFDGHMTAEVTDEEWSKIDRL